jgi:hypothetical protein
VTLEAVDYRRRWQAEPQDVPAAPHPAPEVGARPATPEEIPTGARRVMKAAVAAGWEVLPTYAKGHAVDSSGHAKALTHSVALRMHLPHTRYRAAAVWTSAAILGPLTVGPGASKWSADSAYAWGAGMMPTVVPLTASKAHPDALSLGAYLVTPSRLTNTSIVDSVSGDEGSAT